VGERIPRILVHCGHTFCTECLQQLHHRYRVRCPICRKLVKQVESVDKLPLNFNILYEVVERDHILREINYEDDACMDCLKCERHDQRVQHFYCSNHLTVFCRECIKENHTDEKCFVVDLYEIEKMRKMHKQNQQMNRAQLEKRKDDSSESYVSQEIPSAHLRLGDSKWFLRRKEELLRKKQLQAEEEARLRHKFLSEQQALGGADLRNQLPFTFLPQLAGPPKGWGAQAAGGAAGELISQQQMIDFGYLFLNGNIDDFLSNKSISDEQKKQFISLASSSQDYQNFLIQAAAKKAAPEDPSPALPDKLPAGASLKTQNKLPTNGKKFQVESREAASDGDAFPDDEDFEDFDEDEEEEYEEEEDEEEDIEGLEAELSKEQLLQLEERDQQMIDLLKQENLLRELKAKQTEAPVIPSKPVAVGGSGGKAEGAAKSNNLGADSGKTVAPPKIPAEASDSGAEGSGQNCEGEGGLSAEDDEAQPL